MGGGGGGEPPHYFFAHEHGNLQLRASWPNLLWKKHESGAAFLGGVPLGG